MSMVMWASEFWSREIEIQKLRTYAAYLNLKSELSEYIANADMPEELRRRECGRIAEWVEILERTARQFYAYLEAVAQFEQKLYGVSLFDEKQKRTIDTIVMRSTRCLSIITGLSALSYVAANEAKQRRSIWCPSQRIWTVTS